MKIMHYRPFFTGLLCLVFAIACALYGALNGFQVRHGVGLLLLLAMGGVNFWYSGSKDSLETEIRGAVDERTLFIATQSGHRAVQIMNGLIFSAAILAFLAYGFTRRDLWLAAGLTLCGVELAMFLVLLAVNCYYEKKY